MKKIDLIRFAFTWLLGYCLADAMLPIDNWMLRFYVSGAIVSVTLSVAIGYRLYEKRKERKRKLVDWTGKRHFHIIRWDKESGTLSLLQPVSDNKHNWRLNEEVVRIDTLLDIEKKNLFVTMEGICITLDGETTLEEEVDGLLLKQKNVWLKIPDCDVVREFFVNV